MAFVPNSNSVVAFQSDPTKLVATVSVVSIPPIAISNSSIVAVPVGSVITVGQGSIAAVIVGGSIAASFTPPANQSVSGTVGSSIIGQLPGGTAMLGSVVSYQGVTPWVTVPTSGSVIATQGGTWSTSVMTNVITSIATAGQVMGSVATLQATNPWIVNFQNSSIIAIQSGSVITIVPGSIITVQQANSIVGTYAEDSAHTSGDKGVFSLHVRNDTMSSITSTDTDYSPFAVGPVGELLTANSPLTKWVSGTVSVLNQFGTSMATITAQGSSIFTYITGVQVANMSGSSVLITLSGATSSILGYTIAPIGGGSNIIFPNPLKTNANGAFTTSVSGVCSVYLSAQGFISKT